MPALRKAQGMLLGVRAKAVAQKVVIALPHRPAD